MPQSRKYRVSGLGLWHKFSTNCDGAIHCVALRCLLPLSIVSTDYKEVLKFSDDRVSYALCNECEYAPIGVRAPLPEVDAHAAHCHAQPISSSCAYLTPLFAKNQPEVWFSDRVQATLVGSQEPSALDKRRAGPISKLVDLRIWLLAAQGTSRPQGRPISTFRPAYV